MRYTILDTPFWNSSKEFEEMGEIFGNRILDVSGGVGPATDSSVPMVGPSYRGCLPTESSAFNDDGFGCVVSAWFLSREYSMATPVQACYVGRMLLLPFCELSHVTVRCFRCVSLIISWTLDAGF